MNDRLLSRIAYPPPDDEDVATEVNAIFLILHILCKITNSAILKSVRHTNVHLLVLVEIGLRLDRIQLLEVDLLEAMGSVEEDAVTLTEN